MSSKNRFGDALADHLLEMRWSGGAWNQPTVREVTALDWMPHTRGLHYGQAVFEGQKAHKAADGSVAYFRARDHLTRLNRSAQRLCMPSINVDAVMDGMMQLLEKVADQCPAQPGSLYIRPLLIADEVGLLAEPADSYLFLVLASPVDAYLRRDRMVRLRTELECARAFPGGTGDVKYSGNYAAVYEPKMRARSEGFDEILWLDAIEKRFVEETSSMNVMLVRDGVLVTPKAGGTILPGITRDTLLTLAQAEGIEVREERIDVEGDWSDVTEIFTSGTAVGVLPIGEVVHRGVPLFQADQAGPVCQKLAQLYARLVAGEFDHYESWLSRVSSTTEDSKC